MDPKPGDALGGYVITERLVAGGMAKVYRGRQASTGREVAIKVLTLDADPDLRARFEHEARVLAALQHPHILGLIDAGREGEWLYLVMPLVRCGDLADLIAREDGPLPLPLLRRSMLQLCAALDYAHGQGVVHRDIKPANVLLDERGNCLLTDFGIALSADAKRLTIAGFYIGTPEYLPPEQSAGRVDARSDLYSLGVVLFQMATGRLPFTAHTPLDWLRAHSDTPVPGARSINPDLPPALEQVISKALAKAPEARYQNAGQFAAAIREALPESRYGESADATETTAATSHGQTRATAAAREEHRRHCDDRRVDRSGIDVVATLAQPRTGAGSRQVRSRRNIHHECSFHHQHACRRIGHAGNTHTTAVDKQCAIHARTAVRSVRRSALRRRLRSRALVSDAGRCAGQGRATRGHAAHPHARENGWRLR